MQKALFILCFVTFLGLSVPAQAQLRQDVISETAPAKLYEQSGAGFSLNKFFSPAHFKMSHSVEFSAGSFAGQTTSLGMYTNTMMWQFNQKLAARVDVAVAYSPQNNVGSLTGSGNNARVFLRNAEVVYRPTEKSRLHLSFRQSPYGAYASPYGYYGYRPYGYYGRYNSFNAAYSTQPADLFWNDNLR